MYIHQLEDLAWNIQTIKYLVSRTFSHPIPELDRLEHSFRSPLQIMKELFSFLVIRIDPGKEPEVDFVILKDVFNTVLDQTVPMGTN
jgi:hypothetical protein